MSIERQVSRGSEARQRDDEACLVMIRCLSFMVFEVFLLQGAPPSPSCVGELGDIRCSSLLIG